MKVLSLFDGISCARIALERLGYKDVTYYASEVDKYAIQIAQKNFPDTIQVGDITKLKSEDFKDIDLMIGGSPCQDLSIAKKDRQGLKGARSGLFFEYVRLLKEIKPKYWVLENVNSMPKEAKEQISEILGVQPIMINAALVSAQNRKRLFWTNIQGITQPEDRGILLKDILESGDVDRLKSYAIDANYYRGGSLKNYLDKKRRGVALRQSESRLMVRVGQLNKGGQGDRIYSPDGKSVALSANGGGRGAKTGLYAIKGLALRNRGEGKKPEVGGAKANSLTTVQTDSMVLVVPNGKKLVLGESDLQVFGERRTELGKQSRKEIRKETGKDSTKRSKEHKEYFGKEGLKANCITTGLGVEGLIAQPPVIRKLTPIECERLQCLPDNYTDGVSNTQRYKALGNAFNVEVVKHILSFI